MIVQSKITPELSKQLAEYTDGADSFSVLSRAHSLAHVLYGQGGDGFRTYNQHIQDDVLWLLASEIGKGIQMLLLEQAGVKTS